MLWKPYQIHILAAPKENIQKGAQPTTKGNNSQKSKEFISIITWSLGVYAGQKGIKPMVLWWLKMWTNENKQIDSIYEFQCCKQDSFKNVFTIGKPINFLCPHYSVHGVQRKRNGDDTYALFHGHVN